MRQHTCTSDQDTSGLSEEWHSYFKSSEALLGKLLSRRLDWLLWVLLFKVLAHYMAKDGAQQTGMLPQCVDGCVV